MARVSEEVAEPSVAVEDSTTPANGADSADGSSAPGTVVVEIPDVTVDVSPHVGEDSATDEGVAVTAFMSVAAVDVDGESGAPTTSTDPLGDLLAAIFLGLQRTLFNQSPTANPKQNVDAGDGFITGDVSASDPDQDPLSVVLAQGPSNGSVVVNPDGTYRYTPSDALAATGGTDTFSVTITETNAANHIHGITGLLNAFLHAITGGAIPLNDGSSITQTVTVTVAAVGPIAGTPAYTIDATNPATGVVTGHLNVTSRGETLTYAISDPPVTSTGTVSVDAASGQWIFTPTTSALLIAWQGSTQAAAFTITASDGQRSVDVSVAAPVGVSADALITLLQRYGSTPSGVAVGADGTVYVTNSGANTLSVIHPDGSSIISDVKVGASPSAVAVTPDGRVWVTNASDGTVTVLDHNGTIIGSSIDVGSSPAGVVIGPNDLAYVANAGDGTVSVIDTTTATVDRTVTVGGSPTGIALGPDGRVYVTDFSGTTVTVIDTADDDSLTTIEGAGDNPFGIAVGADGSVYVTHPLEGTVTVLTLNEDGHTSRTVTVGAAPTAITLGPNGTVYVANNGANNITAIDAATLTTTTTTVGANPNSIAARSDGSLYITNAGDDTLTVINPQGEAAATDIGVATTDVSTNAAGDLTLTNRYDNSTTIIHSGWQPPPALDPAVIATIAVGPSSDANISVVISPDGNRAYTLTTQGVNVIDTASNTLVATIPTGSRGDIVISPDGSRLYITDLILTSPTTNRYTQIVNVIDTTTNTLITTIPTSSSHVGGGDDGVSISPDGRRLYTSALISTSTTGRDTQVITVINTTTNTLIATIPTGSWSMTDGDRDVVVSADGRRVYATDRVYNTATGQFALTVNVIDTSTNTLITTIPTSYSRSVNDGFRHDSDVVVGLDSHLYVTSSIWNSTRSRYEQFVNVIDTTTNTITNTIPISNPYPWSSGHNGGLVISPDGGRLYSTDLIYNSNTQEYTNVVNVIDTATSTVTATIAADSPSLGGSRDRWVEISPDGLRLYAMDFIRTSTAGQYAQVLNVIDTATNTLTATIPLFGGAAAFISSNSQIAISEDGDRVYIPASILNSSTGEYEWVVSVVDTTKIAFPKLLKANDDIEVTHKNTPVMIQPLANDTNLNGDTLTITGYTTPAHGTVVLSGTAFTYTPATNFAGTDTFTYTVISADLVTDTGKITVYVDESFRSYEGPTNVVGLWNTLRDKTTNTVNSVATQTVKWEISDGNGGWDIDPDGETRLIVYLGGTTSDFLTGNQAIMENIPATMGLLKQDQVDAINQAISRCESKTSCGPVKGIMFVGYSQGGIDAQNLAAAASSLGWGGLTTTVVTFASPITRVLPSEIGVLHLADPFDPVPQIPGVFTGGLLTGSPVTVAAVVGLNLVSSIWDSQRFVRINSSIQPSLDPDYMLKTYHGGEYVYRDIAQQFVNLPIAAAAKYNFVRGQINNFIGKVIDDWSLPR